MEKAEEKPVPDPEGFPDEQAGAGGGPPKPGMDREASFKEGPPPAKNSPPLRMLAIDAGETSGEKLPPEHGHITRKNLQQPSDSSHESLRKYKELKSSLMESGSGVISNVDRMSNEDLYTTLCYTLQRVSELPGPTAREFLKAKVQETEALFHEFQREAQEVAQLKADCQRLHQELQEAKGIQKTGILTDFLPKFFKTDFHIQVRVTGKTGGCEDQFLKKVSDRLSDHRIKLKPERYREGSSLFLLVFCPVVSRVGTDMQNALEGLQGEPKAVLVMLHHKLKENTFYVDTKPQAQHPAIVRTVHARYILDVGFYTCPMNEEAVAIVAEVLEDRCKGGKRDTTTPGTPSKS